MDEQDTTQQPDEQAPVMHPLFADILREFGLPVAPTIRLATTTGGETPLPTPSSGGGVMSKPKPIAERIDDALKYGSLEYYDLAAKVFPREQFPKAWRYQSNGGPPGLVMALSRAIDRHGFSWSPTYPGKSIPGRIIHPRRKEIP